MVPAGQAPECLQADRCIAGIDQAPARFRAVQEAYETLADVERRKAYDETRRSSLIDDPLAVAREIWSNYLGNMQK